MTDRRRPRGESEPFGSRNGPREQQYDHGRRDNGRLIDIRPVSTYEVLTRQMVDALAHELDRIRGRLDGLLWMVAAAIVLNILMRLGGIGD